LCRLHDPDVLYVIHYLGWPQPLAEFKEICDRRAMLLVEDCALSLLSEPDGQPLGSVGDWSIFCLYKTLPVPNGALLVQNAMPLGGLDRLRLRKAGAASVLGRIAELLVQRVRGRMDGIGTALQSAKRAVGKAAGALDTGLVDHAHIRARHGATRLIDDRPRNLDGGGDSSARKQKDCEKKNNDRKTDRHVGSSRRLSRRRKDAPGLTRFPDSRIDAARLSSRCA
jgi:hypothetical protein